MIVKIHANDEIMHFECMSVTSSTVQTSDIEQAMADKKILIKPKDSVGDDVPSHVLLISMETYNNDVTNIYMFVDRYSVFVLENGKTVDRIK